MPTTHSRIFYLYKIGIVKEIYRGANFFLSLDKEDKVYLWGRVYGNTSKDVPVTLYHQDKPRQVIIENTIQRFKSVAIGSNHIILQDYDNRVNPWVSH